MKKTILLTSFMISFIWQSFSYTLSQNINWYNVTWIVSGIYTETELHSNLTNTASTIKSAICPAPDALTATDIMANTANLGWTENGTAIAWDIEIVTDGETATGNPTFFGVTNSYTVSGLTGDTAYNFYVRANCGNEETSDWVGPFGFTTTCLGIAASYTEHFEAFTIPDGFFSHIPFSTENCWSANNTGLNWAALPRTHLGITGSGPDPSITTGKYFGTVVSSPNPENIAELVSPSINLSNLVTPTLTFNYHMYGEYIGTLEVLVNGTDNVWSLIGEQQTSATELWRLATVDLSNYADEIITVTFKATAQYASSVAIDNVFFTEPSVCLRPNRLYATNITATTASLGWTENGTATAWDIEIVSNGETATGNSTFSGVTNSHTVSNLTANTAYDFYVRANCGNEGTSNWVGPLTFITSCETIEEAPYIEYFETFTPESNFPFYLENCWRGAINSANTGAYFWKPVAGNEYTSANTGPDPSITSGNYFYTEADNSNAGDIAELVTPLIDLSNLVTPALTFNYHMYGDQIGSLDVLVNGTDNVWSLSREQQTSGITPWRIAVIDLANYAGETISVTFKATSEGRPKGDIAIDDVSFIELPTCLPPNTLTATNITTTTASLRWNENGIATSWNIELVNITAGETVTGIPTALGVTNPYTATNLIDDNNYEFYVQADCGNDNGVSSWVGPFSFTTAYAVVDPTCSNGLFLDSGGQSNNYSDDETITYTICPENEGDFVAVYFTSFEIESGFFVGCVDGLTIYDGEDNTAATINPPSGGTMWCFQIVSGFELGTGDLQGITITSTDASGCLTFVFTSDETITYSGWTATVSCNSLSADDVDNSATFTYFPNPVKNTLTFSALNKIESIIVYNMLGQETIKAVPNALESTLDMSGLEIGTYFMKVTIQNSTQTIRIVKE